MNAVESGNRVFSGRSANRTSGQLLVNRRVLIPQASLGLDKPAASRERQPGRKSGADEGFSNPGHWPVGSRTGAVFRRSGLAVSQRFRSEERRVGKESRPRGAPD